MQYLPISQSPDAKLILGSVFISLFFLTPKKVDYVAPVIQIFSIFFFPGLYSLSYKNFLFLPHFVGLRMETVHFMKC